MNDKNNDNNDHDKNIEKKEENINNIFDKKEKNEKDITNEKKEEDKNENIKLNNNIIPLDEEKEKNEEKEKIDSNKKEKNRRVPIKDWACRSLKEYQIINEIGEGAYGIVYKAKYIGEKEYKNLYGIPDVVALKQIKTEKEKEGFPITALREIIILKELEHKNIVKLLEVVISEPKKDKRIEEGKINRDVYLVFEFMKHDLFGIISNNIVYNLSQIKYIFHELVLGLKYLHDNNILHRDLKPSNILLNDKNEIKIGDFGLARIFSKSSNVIKRYTNRVVTTCYRAPELILGETNYTTEVDIWSLGCILLELLTRKNAFYFKDDNEEGEATFGLICKLCGNPNEENWKGVTQYKNYKFIPKENYQCKINIKTFPNLDEVTLDIIKKMLTLNPKKRITLDEILKHPFLTSHEPKMCKAEDMPKIEESFNSLNHGGCENEKKKEKIEMKIAGNDYLGKKKKK